MGKLKLTVIDMHGDGFTSATASLKVYEDKDKENPIFSVLEGKFDEQVHIIEVNNVSPPPTKAPTKPQTQQPTKPPNPAPPTCTNEDKKPFRKAKGKAKMRCKGWAKRKKCNEKSDNGKFISERCRNACKKCNE
jgi:hypothetical protein